MLFFAFSNKQHQPHKIQTTSELITTVIYIKSVSDSTQVTMLSYYWPAYT